MPHALESYGKVHQLSDLTLKGLLDEPCYVQEKVDGSQFSFGVDGDDGRLLVRSRGAMLNVKQPQKLFSLAIQTAEMLHKAGRLKKGLVYRGEAVCSPRHNKINYKAVPAGGIVLYDVFSVADNKELSRTQTESLAKELGLLYAPVLGVFENPKEEITPEVLKKIAEKTKSVINSSVGVEGVVIKRCDKEFRNLDGKIGRGKYVCDEFKEIDNTKKSAEQNDFNSLAQVFAPEARKDKMIQRLKESGEYTGTMKDMGKMVPMLIADVEEECMQEMQDLVYKFVRKKVHKGLTSDLAQWLKDKLMSDNVG